MDRIKMNLKNIMKAKIFWPLVVLCLIVLSNLIFSPEFFRIEIRNGHLYGSIIDILNRGSTLVILAIGMTLVIATAGIDISVGSVLAISGAVACFSIGPDPISKMPFALAIFLALFASMALGMWNGFLVAKVGIQPVIATLILMVAGRGIAQLITSAQILTVDNQSFVFIGNGFPMGLPFSIFLAVIVFIIATLIVKKTAFGLFLEALGSNSTASRFSGLPVKKIIFSVYVFSGLCAGLAGLLACSLVKSADANNAGLFIEMDAILAVVLGGNSMQGGRFNILGSVIGALTIQSLTTTILTLGVAPQVIQVVKALVVIAIFIIQSQELRNMLSERINKNRRHQHEKETIKL
jgi:galactofuranose transport system permease protein